MPKTSSDEPQLPAEPTTELDLERIRADYEALTAQGRRLARQKIPALLPGADEDPGVEVDPNGQYLGRTAYLNGELERVQRTLQSREPAPVQDSPHAENTEQAFDLARTMGQAEELEKLSLEDLAVERTRIAWRLSREMARSLMLIMADESLLELPMEPDPWESLCTPMLAGQPSRGGDVVRICTTRRRAILELQASTAGLLPPEPPVEDLDPKKDGRLRAWTNAQGAIASLLGIGRTSRREALALQAMRDVEIARLCWPSREEIILHEEAVVATTAQLLAESGFNETVQHLRSEYGLTHIEALGIARMGMEHVRTLAELDLEDQRALMAARVDNYIKRCRESNDRDREIRGLKLLTVVQGLTRTEPENAARAFVAAVTEVAQSGAPKHLVDAEVEIIDAPVG